MNKEQNTDTWSIKEVANTLEKHGLIREQEPCEDCISRQAVKEKLREEWVKYVPMELDINLSFVLEKISELPSVTSKIDVLDNIRAEFISLYPKNFAGEPELGGSSCVFSLNKILRIIDKYRAESEDK